MIEDILAVAESVDFGPSHEGESFVLVTLRIPRESRIGPGLYVLKWTAPATLVQWAKAKAKDEDAYGKRREASERL